MWSLPRRVREVILEACSSALDVDPVFLCSGYTAQMPAWSAPVPGAQAQDVRAHLQPQSCI